MKPRSLISHNGWLRTGEPACTSAEICMTRTRTSLLLPTLSLAVLILGRSSGALASTIWYVSGGTGKDSNNCRSAATACKTIGHAISLAASGDSVMVAAALYTEHLTIRVSLNVIGSGAGTTIIDGGSTGPVVDVYSPSTVTISNVTIRNGRSINGGGVGNSGILTINHSSISGNLAYSTFSSYGGGVFNGKGGNLTLNSSTVSGNHAYGKADAWGGGISSWGIATINNSTVSGNNVGSGSITMTGHCGGAGINNGGGTLTINNSTVAGNGGGLSFCFTEGGGILSDGVLTISNSTISGNVARQGGGIRGQGTLQNSLVANNNNGNCYGSVSAIFSLSSDNSCNLTGPGDKNNTNPKLGTLGNYGGPTQTIPLLSGSPAIDAGDRSGCIDSQGNRFTTDQRGLPRPDKEDTGGCDMGAYESQGD